MQTKKLTQKQSKFSLMVVALGNQSDAYRAAYNCANSNSYTVTREASRLMDNPNITTRIKEIQQSIENNIIEDKTWMMAQLVEIVEDYKAKRQTASSAIKAIALMCKIMGWYHQYEKPKPQIRSAVIIYDPDNNNEITRMEG